MKRPFALLLLNDDSATWTRAQIPSYAKLQNLAKELNLPVFTEADIKMTFRLDSEDKATIFLICGNPTAEMLENSVHTLFERDRDCIVVLDALEARHNLHETFLKLNKPPFGPTQFGKTGEMKSLITAKRYMTYAFPKADSTTTTVTFIDWWTNNPKVATIVRGKDPYKGYESLPGGFLDVHLETLAFCAQREPTEETNVTPDCVELIDVRSAPDRDERGHVIDHGYAWFVPKNKRNKVFNALEAGDDAQAGSAKFTPVRELLQIELAFDHKALFLAAYERMKVRRWEYLRRSRAAARRR
jgi:ADP-ribose pyrophosphatase YjhB (NUDIX family)